MERWKVARILSLYRKRLLSYVAKAITSCNDETLIRRFSQYREILEQFQQSIQGRQENWQEVSSYRMDNGHDCNKFW